jgi:hypothetical protein
LNSKRAIPIHTGSAIIAFFGNDTKEGAGATIQDTVTTGPVERIPLEGDIAIGELCIAECVGSMELGGRADQNTGDVEVQGLIVEQLQDTKWYGESS